MEDCNDYEWKTTNCEYINIQNILHDSCKPTEEEYHIRTNYIKEIVHQILNNCTEEFQLVTKQQQTTTTTTQSHLTTTGGQDWTQEPEIGDKVQFTCNCEYNINLMDIIGTIAHCIIIVAAVLFIVYYVKLWLKQRRVQTDNRLSYLRSEILKELKGARTVVQENSIELALNPTAPPFGSTGTGSTGQVIEGQGSV